MHRTVAQAEILTDGQEDAVAAKNARLYAMCVALSMSAAPISVALGGLAGSYLLGDDKSLATAPVSAYLVGVALGAMPAAMLMQKIGRKSGFMTGAIIGITGLLVACWAIAIHHFWLFLFGMLMFGVSGGFAQQYRFAAADRGTEKFRARAISRVLAGGVIAAIVGPQLIIWTTDLLAPIPFAGAFLGGSAMLAGMLIVLSFLEPSMPPRPAGSHSAGTGRPLREIMTQPKYLVSVLCATGSYATMSFVMTAAPLAMVACGHSQTESTLGIQWHVLAMFAPSFFTGGLISRFGHEKIIVTGFAILAACAAVALGGLALANFWISLILLGLGWNLAFIGSTAMLTRTYSPEEKNKAQGANDLILFSTVAASSLLSGQMLNLLGWLTINWFVFPVIAICLGALFWQSRRQEEPSGADA
jgi:MFS family permease